MHETLSNWTTDLWRGALAAGVLSIIAAAACRWLPCRPATRHAIWVAVLGALVLTPALPPLFPQPPQSTVHPPSHLDLPAVVPTPAYTLRNSPPPPTREQPAPPPRSHNFLPTKSAHRTTLSSLAVSPTRSDLQPPGTLDASAEPHPTAPTPPWTVARTESDDKGQAPSPADSVGRLSEIPPDHAFRNDGLPTFPNAPIRIEFDSTNPHALSSPEQRPDLSNAPTFSAPRDSINPTSPVSLSLLTRLRQSAAPWIQSILTLRDAYGRVPALPINLWLAGILAACLYQVLRAAAFCKQLRNARPPTPAIRQMVADAASQMGLRRPPLIRLVRSMISPALWCAGPARLILPAALWAQLDDPGRRAVILHELAHLRRKDHWVCRAAFLIGLIYWWNPFVWWIRRKIEEEADICCDAWVTWLIPRGRRTYAEALLITNQFLSRRPIPTPTLAVGVATRRARPFARRLTMVMTRDIRPKISRAGISLALAIAAAGWIATPARSANSTDSKVTVAQPASNEDVRLVRHASVPPTAPSRADSPTPPETPVPTALPALPALPYVANSSENSATPVPFAASSSLNAPALAAPDNSPPPRQSNEPTDQRLERLERRLAELSEQIAALSGQALGAGPRAAQPATPREYVPDASTRFLSEVLSETGSYAPLAALSQTDRSAQNAVFARVYRLPNEKMAALRELMVRSDVPILVTPMGDEQLQVQASEAQHVVFAAFVAMLCDTEEVQEYKLPPGQREALTKLMSRDDVPARIDARDDGIALHGDGADHATFKAFIEMIQPRTRQTNWSGFHGSGASGGTGWSSGDSSAEHLALALEEQRAAAARARDEAAAAAAEALRLHEHLGILHEKSGAPHVKPRSAHHDESSRSKLDRLRAIAAELEFRAEQLEADCDGLRDKIDELKDQAAAARADAEQLTGQKAEDAMGRAIELERAAHAIEARLHAQLTQMQELARQVELAESQADELEEHLDAAEDEADPPDNAPTNPADR